MFSLKASILSLAVCFAPALAQSTSAAPQPKCSTTLSATYAAPSIAAPYQYRLVASGLKKPRGIKFDSEGNLLVVEQLAGIVALTLSGDGSCLTASKPSLVVNNTAVGHPSALAGEKLKANSSLMGSSSLPTARLYMLQHRMSCTLGHTIQRSPM